MFSNRNDTDLGYHRVIMNSANEKRETTSQNGLIYRVETRRKLEARSCAAANVLLHSRYDDLFSPGSYGQQALSQSIDD
jgi:hypothetical protein